MIHVMGVFNVAETADAEAKHVPAQQATPYRDLATDSGLEQAIRDLVATVDRDPQSFVWIALFEPSVAEMELVKELFSLPRLQVDDALNDRQRAKAEIEDKKAFVVFKLLEYLPETSDIETGQMSVFIGPGYAVTVRHQSSGNMGWVLDRIEDTQALARFGPTTILHSVLDHAVDEYLAVIDEVSAAISAIEESVFAPVRTDDTARIYELKRENLEIRRAVSPMVLAAHRIIGHESTTLSPALRPYFSDIADHILRAGDAVDNNDSLLLTMLMASTARLDLQQNTDMRRISAWVAIAAVPTMIAGIYGMNFEDMPELHEPWGYPAVLLFMATVCTFLYTRFRKSGWL